MFNDMKVGTRLILGFLVVTLLGAVVAGIGIRNMGKLNDEAERVYQQELLGLSYIKDANLNLSNLGRSLRNALLASSEQDRKKFVDDANAQKRLLEQNLSEARQRFVTERGKAMLAELDAKLATYQPLLVQLFDRIDKAPLQQPSETTEFLFGTYSTTLAPVTAQLNDLSKLKADNAKKVAEDSAVLYATSRNTMVVLVLVAGVVGLLLGWLITRRLTRQLGGEPDYAVAVAERIAAGDLVTHVDLRPGDEHSLLHAMQQMRSSLASIVGQVRTGTHAIEAASSEIAAGNLDLSSRTEEQASSLEETASSMEELTSTVKQNADNARQANALALTASEVATRGGAVVSQVVNTMSSINESSRRIVDIISVIDGIAFQTNILALNAAVEAARAGEQGRGFAVVAGEVRNLAQRSAAAAKEIKQLIDDSVHEVDAGAKLVDQAGRTMDEIVESVRRVTDIMGEITSASVEQTAGIEQINEAVAHMDQVTQQNASLVEEAAAASEAMRDQAHKLGEVVRMFRIEETAQQPEPARAGNVVPLARKPARPAPVAARAARPLPAKAANGDEWEEF